MSEDPNLVKQEETKPDLKEKRRMSRRKFLKYSALIAGGLVIPTVLETNFIGVTRHRAVLAGMNAGARPIRVVQLSDLHRSEMVREAMIRRAVETANAEKPDLILLTGDFVTRHASYIDSCVDVLSGLNARLGVWAVLGNHDYWSHEPGRIVRTLERADISVLTNCNTRLEGRLTLVGVDDAWGGHPDIDAAAEGIRPGSPVIAMTHNPRLFDKMSSHKWTVLCGHTHGRQINVPCADWLMGRNMKYVSGWYKAGNASLYVNRGIGVIGLPFRCFAPPEVTVFDFVPAV
jgi:predicted MPP superfamily phosphohydrolase